MNDYRSLLERVAAGADENLLPEPATVRAAGDRRTHRIQGVLAGTAAVIALAVVLALLGHPSHRSTPEPVTPPTPTITGGEAVAANPYLWWEARAWWHLDRLRGAAPPLLTHCVKDPSTWGALKSQVAVYGNPRHPGKRVNEFLLQYPDGSSAHHAFLDAWHQVSHCPRPPTVSDFGQLDPQRREVYAKDMDEGFGWGRNWESPNPSDAPRRVFGLRVARAGNVLVVLEDTFTDMRNDRTAFNLSQMVQQAVPDYYYRHD